MHSSDGVFNFPIFSDMTADDMVKVSHDRYDVYVNGNFVGHKTLLTQSEDITDVNDFLHIQGYGQYKYKLDGDHFEISVDESTEREMVEVLQIYLQSR